MESVSRLVTCYFGALGEDGRLDVSCMLLSGEEIDFPGQSGEDYVGNLAWKLHETLDCGPTDICFVSEAGDILFHRYCLADAARGGPSEMVNRNRELFKEADALRPASCRRLEVLSAYLDDLLQMGGDLVARYNTDERGLLLFPHSRPPDDLRLAWSRRGARSKLDSQWKAWRLEVAKEEEAGVLEGAAWARFCLRAGEADARNHALTLRQALQEGATLERSLSSEDCRRLWSAMSCVELDLNKESVGQQYLKEVARHILPRLLPERDRSFTVASVD